jgi:hypothetical protein
MSLFDGNSEEEQVNPLEKLVGEDKKFKSVEDLAKGKLEADAFIERLKQEKEEMRKDLDARLTVEEALSKMNNRANDVTSDITNQDRQEGDTGVDLDKLVEEKISIWNQQQAAMSNEQSCNQMMVDRYGEKAKDMLVQISKQKGVSLEMARTLAQQSPAAFKSLMGLDQSSSVPSSTSGTVNTQTLSSSQQKDRLTELSELRKTNPRQYWKPEVQNEIMKLHAQNN